MENKTVLSNIIRLLVLSTIGLIPILFLPTTVNFFATNKQMLLLVTTSLGLVLWSVNSIKNNNLRITLSPLLAPLFLFLAATILSIVLQPQGKTESLLNRGSLFIALPLWYLLVASASKTKSFVQRAILALSLSSTLLAIHGILQIIALYSIKSLPVWMQSKAFTPAGSPLILITLLAAGLALTLPWALRELEPVKKTFLFVLSGIQAAAFVAYLSLMLPGGELTPAFLPLNAGWSLTLDALKTPKVFLTGIGIPNFPTLYMQAKPLFLNATPFWNTLPQFSSNEFLHILTTMGALGFVSLMWLVVRGLRLAVAKDNSSAELFSLRTALAIILLSFFITPASVPTYFLLFTLLALITIVRKYESKDISDVILSVSALQTVNATAQESAPTRKVNFIPYLFGIVNLVIVGLFLFYGSRAYSAEVALRDAQNALLANDGKTVYEKHILAIQKLPTVTSYRTSYSQINLTLAGAVSKQENLSDADRQQIAQLVQQAVREARTATSLQPADATTWTNLGSIYRNLINVAEGSDQFAVEAYGQAVNLDPANPALRVEYGGLFYQLSQLPQPQPKQGATAKEQQQAKTQYEANKIALLQRAVGQFQTALQLKPDFANAYYNLSKSLEAGGNIQGATEAMQQAIANLPKDAPDYEKALDELSALQTKLPKDQPSEDDTEDNQEQSQLQEPSPLPSPIPGGPITLPDESPTPNRTPSPTATSTPTP